MVNVPIRISSAFAVPFGEARLGACGHLNRQL